MAKVHTTAEQPGPAALAAPPPGRAPPRPLPSPTPAPGLPGARPRSLRTRCPHGYMPPPDSLRSLLIRVIVRGPLVLHLKQHPASPRSLLHHLLDFVLAVSPAGTVDSHPFGCFLPPARGGVCFCRPSGACSGTGTGSALHTRRANEWEKVPTVQSGLRTCFCL